MAHDTSLIPRCHFGSGNLPESVDDGLEKLEKLETHRQFQQVQSPGPDRWSSGEVKWK
jgi:hypothetical protein